MLNACKETQGLYAVLCKAWGNRPSDKTTHYDPLHRGFYSVCEFYSDAKLFFWCESNESWLEVDDSQLAKVLERIHPFHEEHKQ